MLSKTVNPTVYLSYLEAYFGYCCEQTRDLLKAVHCLTATVGYVNFAILQVPFLDLVSILNYDVCILYYSEYLKFETVTAG